MLDTPWRRSFYIAFVAPSGEFSGRLERSRALLTILEPSNSQFRHFRGDSGVGLTSNMNGIAVAFLGIVFSGETRLKPAKLEVKP